MTDRLDQKRPSLRLKDNWVREKLRNIRYSNIELNNNESFHIHPRPSYNIADELQDLPFECIFEIFKAVQHAYLYGDLHAFLKIGGDTSYVNFVLRIANSLLLGRKFNRINGQVTLVKYSKMECKEEKIAELYYVMMKTYCKEYDEVPTLHLKLKELTLKYTPSY